MINWRRIRRKEHDKKRCNMVCQKALLWQIHNAGILSVEGVVGMDLIDRHGATSKMFEICDMVENELLHIDVIIDALENLPSAEPDIIRCRDCKHHDGIRCFRWNSTIITGFDDFCSNAERRTDE